MKRLLAFCIAVFVLSGCQGQGTPGTDPFFGRTTVPPPGTGTISGDPTTPYYGGTPYSGAPSYAPPANVTPQMPPGGQYQPPASGGGQPYAPPGGSFNYQGSSWTPMGTSVASRPETSVSAPSLFDRARDAAPQAAPTLARRERVIQVLQPRAKPSTPSQESRVPPPGRASTLQQPGRFRAADEAIEITDLPRTGRVTSAARPQSTSGESAIRLASNIAGPADSGDVQAAVGESSEPAEFAPPSNYAHDPDYRRLRGKLEYSQIDRRWKLRYIPLDGATDDFGGSVVLPDEKFLAGCERGDFVEVRGQVGQKDPDSSYAPQYEATEVKRLSRAVR